MLNLDQQNENRKLNRNLLEQVVLRIDYKDIVKIDQDLEKEITIFLRRNNFEYIRVGKMNEAKLSLEVSDKDQMLNLLPLELIKSRDVFEYQSQELNQKITLSPLFATIEQKEDIRENYAGFESLFNILSELITKLNDKENLEFVRIGIRKINSKLMTSPHKLVDYFNEFLINDISSPNIPFEAENLNTRISKLYNFNYKDCNINLKTELTNGILSLDDTENSDIQACQFLLDFDVYSNINLIDIDIENIKTLFNLFNDRLYNLFLWSLTDKAKDLLIKGESFSDIDM